MKRKSLNEKQENEILNHKFQSRTNEISRNEISRKKKHKKRLPVILGTIGAFILMGSGAGWYVLASPLKSHTRILPSDSTNNAQINTTPNAASATGEDMLSQDRINILLIGTDTRPGESELSSNTDSLILASIDSANQQIEMLSIPRDTRVEIPGRGMDKINAALPIGGVKLTEQLVANLLGQPIDYYAITKFGGLKGIVDTVGGITINVDRNMYYNTGDTTDNIIDLKKGLQTLNGSQALGYVRFREDALGDIQRTMRQQIFLQALKEKLLSVQTIPKLPSIIQQFWSMFNTNLPQNDALKLATRAGLYSKQPVIHETLPGSFETINGVSYWQVNPTEAKYVTNQLLADGKVQQNPVQDPEQTINWQPATDSASDAGSGSSTNPSDSSANANNNSSEDSQTNTTGTDKQQNTQINPSSDQTPDQSTNTNTDSNTNTNTGIEATSSANLNVRSGPSTSYQILTSLTIGQHVQILKQLGEWDEIQLTDGTIGYVSSAYLN